VALDLQDAFSQIMTPVLISKSHMESFWTCPRAGYWAYMHGGAGIKPVGQSFDLEYGTIIHEALANLAQHDDGTAYRMVQTTVRTLCTSLGRNGADANQWGAIAEGSMRGFMISLWPKLMQEYRVTHVEPPCVLPLGDDVYFVARPDLIIQHRTTGEYWYVEYKTTSARFDARWLGQWNTAVQVHSGLRAAEQTLHIPLAGCLVLGLSKGYRNSYDGTQASPFAWGWVRRGSPGVVPDQYQVERPKSYKGWEKFPTWTLTEGLGPWVQHIQHECPQVLEGQYGLTPPILIRNELVEVFLREVRVHAARLRQLMGASTEQYTDSLDDLFPHTFRACEPGFGSKCSYRDACWTPWIGEDPVGSGLYEERDTSHQEPFIALIPTPMQA